MENENLDIENLENENVTDEKNSNPFAEGLEIDDIDNSEEASVIDEDEIENMDENDAQAAQNEDEQEEEPDVEFIDNADDFDEDDEPEVEFIDNSEDDDEQEEEPEVEYLDGEDDSTSDEVDVSEEKPQKKNIFESLFSKKNKSAADLKKLKEECEKINNQYLRLAADFDNYRKRQVSEREGLIKYGMEQALRKMIEVSDNFERAEKSLESIDDVEKAKEAFTVLAKQFRDSMKKLGLEEINAVGEVFDPNLHEAVMQKQTDEFPEDTVVQELQKGYKYGDKVLRPSMVSVAVN